MIELTLPYPPSSNRLWTRTRRGMRKTDAYCDWLRVGGYMVNVQKPEKLLGPYKLFIQAMRPDRRKRDLDNILKPISDLLQATGVIEDDSYCEMLSARWVTAGAPLLVRLEKAGIE